MSNRSFYAERRLYIGDLHNHCGISYAHGTLDDALANARLQLDFVSITGHASWPDVTDQSMPAEVVEYHERGFAKLRNGWGRYLDEVERANRPGEFATFFGYEVHSFRHGDRTIVSPEPLSLPGAEFDMTAFEQMLETTDARRDRRLLLPHHIGYPTGLRGINWESVHEAATPVIEILSMHGLAETGHAAFPYLHTMGPLDERNTMTAGLKTGLHFGVVASTDHHSAHPGSFGHGRTAVWATDCTREAIWEAICDRRTYALSGDRIEVEFAVDGHPMGSIYDAGENPPTVDAAVRSGGAIDRIDILRNGECVHTVRPPDPAPAATRGGERGLIVIEMGWGEKVPFEWDLAVRCDGGRFESVEPRLRGHDVVDPLDRAETECHFSAWSFDRGVARLRTRTAGNPTTTTSQTQSLACDVEMGADDALMLEIGPSVHRIPIAELLERDVIIHTAGFVSPAVRVHRFLPERARLASVTWVDAKAASSGTDENFYQLRVVQRNGHAAWTSPVWSRRKTNSERREPGT